MVVVIVLVVVLAVVVVSFATSIKCTTDHRGYLFTANRETRRQEREVERFDKRNLNVPFTLQVDICQTNDEHIVI